MLFLWWYCCGALCKVFFHNKNKNKYFLGFLDEWVVFMNFLPIPPLTDLVIISTHVVDSAHSKFCTLKTTSQAYSTHDQHNNYITSCFTGYEETTTWTICGPLQLIIWKHLSDLHRQHPAKKFFNSSRHVSLRQKLFLWNCFTYFSKTTASRQITF